MNLYSLNIQQMNIFLDFYTKLIYSQMKHTETLSELILRLHRAIYEITLILCKISDFEPK